MKELNVIAKIESLEQVTEFVNEQLDLYNCPIKAKLQIDIVIDELFSNIAQYAYKPDEGPVSIRVEVIEKPISVILTFMDNGVPYNPLETLEPDTALPIEERKVGGLGIFLVKKTMDEICYEYKNNQNVLSVKKKIEE